MCGIIATEIRGKNTPIYKNNIVNGGSTCIIVNATDPLVMGRKLLWKTFRYHTGFIGHLRETPYRDMFVRKPELVVQCYSYAVSQHY
jgi:large subunit ribosomal protein L13